MFAVTRSTKEEPDCVPTASPQVRRGPSPWPPRQLLYTTRRVPRPHKQAGDGGCAPFPAQIHQVRAGVALGDVKRRFLAYSSPSRSPDPPHLAVLERPGFVRAAPTQTGTTRTRLPSAPPTLPRQSRR